MFGVYSVAAPWIEIGLVWLESTTPADFQPMPSPGNQQGRSVSEETPRLPEASSVSGGSVRGKALGGLACSLEQALDRGYEQPARF